MPFVRISRDKRGYDHFFLVHTPPARRGKPRQRILYWFRTPPNAKVGRVPFDESVMRALEAQHPDVTFDWEALRNTPMPLPSVEHWRERRRLERGIRQFRDADDEPEARAEPAATESAATATPAAREPAGSEPLGADLTTERAIPDPASPERFDSTPALQEGPRPLPAAAADSDASDADPQRRRRRRRGRRGRSSAPAQSASLADDTADPTNGAPSSSTDHAPEAFEPLSDGPSVDGDRPTE